MEAKRTKYMVDHPGEQTKELSSEVQTANGNGGEKSIVQPECQRTTYRLTSKGAAGRLLGEKAPCVSDS